MKILDVGCGAGFLSESMTRLGANVIGLDPNPTSFHEAIAHKEGKESLNNLTYFNLSLEQFQSEHENDLNSFDVVTSMEVVEHVDNPKLFFQHISSSMKEDGLVMISTIRRSLATWFSHILMAEKITGIVPSGTHSYEKFINPEECKAMMK